MFNKWIKTVLPISAILLLCSCSTVNINDGQPHWDFDHNVQFRQTQLTDNSYHLIIVAQKKTKFAQLSTFLLRHSKDICQDYGYKIEVISGVQGFDSIQGAPNLIMQSLIANIECKADT